jgi:hypothetical protein
MVTIETPRPVTTRSSEPNGTSSSEVVPLLRRLLAIKPGAHRVVSCYVRLTPEDRRRQQYLTDVKRRAVAVWEAAADRDLKRITEYLGDVRNLPAARGLALFACEEVGLFEAAPVPEVHRTRVAVDGTPRV